jgi:putative aminopeptidase FrvX
MDFVTRLVMELSDASGVVGFEDEVADVVKKHLRPIARIEFDKLGSLIATLKGKKRKPTVALFAHMDEIGFMVKEITDDGFVRLMPLGGWWTHVVLGQRFVVRSRHGDHIGVAYADWDEEKKKWPDDYKKTVEHKHLYVDVGAASGFDVCKLGIRPGDPVVPVSKSVQMSNPNLVMGKALDNRVGVATMISVLRNIARAKTRVNRVVGVATVQEEVGLRGAQTSAWAVNPDVAIVLDTSFAGDVPGSKAGFGRRLGKGPFVNLVDRSTIGNPRLRKLMIETADRLGMDIQITTSEISGTDAGRVHISRAGVPSVYCGVVARGIHGHHGVASTDDIRRNIKLITSVIRRLDSETVESLTTHSISGE